jgi:hypothetical protein
VILPGAPSLQRHKFPMELNPLAELIEDSKVLKPCSIKGLRSPDSNNDNTIWKKPIRIGQVVLAPIAESLVKKLEIDEKYTWFEEIPTSEGILLKITQCSEFLALPKSGKEQN